MNHRKMLLLRPIWAISLLAVLVLTASSFALTADQSNSKYVPNQILVRFAPGTTDAERDAAATKLGAKIVRPIALQNTYLLQLLPTRGLTVESACSRAADVSVIVDTSPDYVCHLAAIPNDPDLNRQWNMFMINAPNAWDLVRGSSSVKVAVLDGGFSLDHPDLTNRFLPGRDTGDNDNDPSPCPTFTPQDALHGTHVSGIIAAQGNNGEGVVGVCWDGVKIIPVKVFPNGLGAPSGSISSVVDGLDFAKTAGANVVNMSLYFPNTSQILHDKIKELYNAGVILVACVGNDNGQSVKWPAAFDEVIAVSAVGPDEAITGYSNIGPETDLAAPGGVLYGGQDEIWSTTWTPPALDKDGVPEVGEVGTNGYGVDSGTSMAAPHVAGAAALLLSAGVPASQVTGLLYRSARAPQSGTLDPLKYGHGILDVYAALTTGSRIEITTPTDGAALDTTTPSFKISTYQVAKQTIKVYMDYQDTNGDGTPDDMSQNLVLDGSSMDSEPNVQWDAVSGTLSFQWPLTGQTSLTPGAHTLFVTGESTGGSQQVNTDWTVFFVQRHTTPAGRHLFSIPYPLADGTTPFDVFGGSNFRLARFIPSRNDYATVNYTNQADDPLAWPSSVIANVHPHGQSSNTPPAGLGFWVELNYDTEIAVDGMIDRTKAYDITLTRGTTGWNMIGNPFPFPVPWESVKVIYQGKTLTLKDAAAAGWIRSAIYRYTKAGYTFLTPPEAVLVPWEGHWVKILPAFPDRTNDSITLVVPPIESGAIVETPRSRATGSDSSWNIRLEARAGDAVDSYNVAGVSGRSVDGYDIQDVEEPPMVDNYVQLAFVHSDWGKTSGRYATDVKSDTATAKSWDFEVTTDMPNKDVSVAWPDITSVSKKYDLVLEDVDSGVRTFMRTRSAYTYNSGATPGTRRFKLLAEPAGTGRLIVSNVVVSRSKASGVGISYTVSRDAQVEVRLRDNHNRLIRTLGGNTTRAAGINTVHWDCANTSGSQVPSGLYLAEIIATGTDGEVVKTVRPIVVR